MEPEMREQMKLLLSREIDWTFLLETAFEHGMMPLLYWHLNTNFANAVPAPIFTRLYDYFLYNAKCALALTGELLKILKLFNDHEISAIPFKGPTLASLVYHNIALRQAGDLDVLIHKSSFTKVKELLISKELKPNPPIPDINEESFLDAVCEHPFVRDDGMIVVDLHWGLTPKEFYFPFNLDKMWERVQPLSFFDTTVLSPATEDLLLILCMHGTKHQWMRLEWICGVAEMIRVTPGIQWERALERANEANSERMLLLGLLLAADILGVNLPDIIWQRINADKSVKAIAKEVRRRLFDKQAGPPGQWATYLFNLKVMNSRRYAIQGLVHTIMTPNLADFITNPLPAAYFPLYYILRPIRLTGKYGLNLLKVKRLSKRQDNCD
jgi:hypothetical protein